LQCEVDKSYTLRIVRILFGCVAFLALAAPMPQSSFNLHARYGEPDVQRFAIRPDITMTVEYGEDRHACIIDVQPRQAFIHGFLGSRESFSKETALELLDEVAPPEIRGIEKVPLFSNDFATGPPQCLGHATFGQYAEANISLAYVVCDPPFGHGAVAVQSARVQFTRPACEPLTKWNGQ
jgi:hypothetical protein